MVGNEVTVEVQFLLFLSAEVKRKEMSSRSQLTCRLQRQVTQQLAVMD